MSETVEATGTALALLGERALVATDVFKPGGVRVILDQIKAEVAGEKIDVSTPGGREHCRSLAFKIARSKTALDGMGKTLSDEWRKRAEAIHAERRLIEKELDALRDRVRAPLTAYEEREKNRVAGHEEALRQLESLAAVESDDCTVDHIDGLLVQASTLVTTRAWEEFQDRASELFAAVNDVLNDLRAKTIRIEAEKAEAARLQAEREEEVRLQAVREQEAREARLAAEAAEEARKQAEDRAARDADAAAARARAAIAAERERVQAEERAAAQIEAKARADRYEAELEAQRRRTAAELVRVQAEERAKAKADLDAQIAADTEAAKKREANVAHKRKVNNDARDAILKAMSEVHNGTADEAKVISTAIVIAIAKGDVPRCRIEY